MSRNPEKDALAEAKRLREAARLERAARVRRAIQNDPELTTTQLVRRFGINTEQLNEIAGDLLRARGKKSRRTFGWWGGV